MILTTLRSRKRSRSNRDAFPHQKPITVTKGGIVGRWGGGGVSLHTRLAVSQRAAAGALEGFDPERIEHPSADPTFEKSQSQLRRRVEE